MMNPEITCIHNLAHDPKEVIGRSMAGHCLKCAHKADKKLKITYIHK